MVSCREIIKLPSMTKLNIVAGKTGLDRMIRWVHFLDLPDVIPWVQGGELLIITGMGLNGDINKLKVIVREIIKKKLAGLIINIGPYIQNIPDEVIHLANRANFPIFELPWEVKIIEITQEICSYIVIKQTEQQSIKDFFEQLLFCPLVDPKVLIQRAAYFGYDLTKPYQVAIIRPVNLVKFSQIQKIKSGESLVALNARFEEIICDSLNTPDRKNLLMSWADNVVFLMPCNHQSRGDLHNSVLLMEILKKLTAKISGLEVTGALGGKIDNVRAARKSYLQALKVLKFAELKLTTKPVYSYDQLGVYKLLFEFEFDKLAEYYNEVIQPLDEYDKQHHMDMAASLFVYFKENCNAAQAAQSLFIHRNTLDYRLKKIQEITGRHFDDPYERLTLQLGVIIGKLLSSNVFLHDL